MSKFYFVTSRICAVKIIKLLINFYKKSDFYLFRCCDPGTNFRLRTNILQGSPRASTLRFVQKAIAEYKCSIVLNGIPPPNLYISFRVR